MKRLIYRRCSITLDLGTARKSIPWSVEEPNPKLDRRSFIVRDANGQGARLRLFRG